MSNTDGQLSFLKAGLQLASQLFTVSPTYAREIQDEHFGYGLAPLLRHRAGDLRGILNGVDTGIWNPATDPALAAGYAANRLAAKRANKTALQAEMGLEVCADRPLFGVHEPADPPEGPRPAAHCRRGAGAAAGATGGAG